MRLAIIPLLLLAAVAAPAAPLHAAAATPAFQLTVTESAAGMTYGGGSPSFRASLTPPADDPSLGGNATYYFSIGGTNFGGSMTSLSAPYTLFLSGLPANALNAGQYNVVASYLSPNHGLLSSAPVTLTVSPATPSLGCSAASLTYTYAPNAPVTVNVTGVSAGAFTVTFAGPQTFTSGPAPLDANGTFTVTGPSVPGQYAPTCNFAGTTNYSAASAPFANRALTVSASHSIAGIALFTDPAPLQSYTPTTWEVVVAGRPGLPAPTGDVSISIGRSFLRPTVSLGPGGTVTFTADSPAADALAGIDVVYMGDSVYTGSSAHLSIVTAPIPHSAGASGSGSGSGSVNGAGATAATSVSGSTAGGSPSASVPGVAQVIDNSPAARMLSNPAHAGFAGYLFLVVVLALAAAVGASALVVVRRRRGRQPSGAQRGSGGPGGV